MADKTKKYGIYHRSNGTIVRLKNKKIITAIPKNSADNSVVVVIKAILAPEELAFGGNLIRGNMKQTAFKLTPEAAEALFYSLGSTLGFIKEKSDTPDADGEIPPTDE